MAEWVSHLIVADRIQYLIATAERADLIGYSDHIVQVIK